ncbi:MAG: hypothetical protein ABSB78_12650 [Bacteroidota bacterium]
MKKILIALSFIFLFSSALSQQDDTLRYRYGILLDHDASVIDQYGFKYRSSESFSLFIRFRLGIYDDNSETTASQSQDGSSFESNIGVEYILARISDISLFASSSIGYSTSRSNVEYSSIAIGNYTMINKNTAYSASLGIGIEYHIARQLSISGNQTVEIKYSRSTESGQTASNTITRTSINVPISTFTLTFYF